MNALRSLLVCLLMVALSCQGMAAAALLPRAAQTPAPAAMHMATRLSTNIATNIAMDRAHASCCHAHGLHSTRHDGHDRARCATCAACCGALALAPAPTLPPAAGGPAHIAVPFRPRHVGSVDPALPERPPRLVLA